MHHLSQEFNLIQHFRMWKSGKHWLFAASTLFLVIGTGALGAKVSADEVQSVPSPVVAASSTDSVSNTSILDGETTEDSVPSTSSSTTTMSITTNAATTPTNGTVTEETTDDSTGSKLGMATPTATGTFVTSSSMLPATSDQHYNNEAMAVRSTPTSSTILSPTPSPSLQTTASYTTNNATDPAVSVKTTNVTINNATDLNTYLSSSTDYNIQVAGNITLTNDIIVEGNKTLIGNGLSTIDTNGYSIYVNYDGASLTLGDGNTANNLTITASKRNNDYTYSPMIGSFGNLVLNDGVTLVNNVTNSYTIENAGSYSTFTANGGIINNTVQNAYGVLIANAATGDISGGNYTINGYGTESLTGSAQYGGAIVVWGGYFKYSVWRYFHKCYQFYRWTRLCALSK